MLNVSVSRLGGLSLIIGPTISVISFLLRPGGGLIGGQVDPADFAASIDVAMANAAAATTSFLLVPIGLIAMLFGFSIVMENLKDKNGEGPRRLGLLFALFGVVGWTMSSAGAVLIAGGDAGASAEAVYAVSTAMNSLASVLASIGFTLLVCGVYLSGQYNKMVTLFVLAGQFVLLVTSVVAAVDLSFAQTAGMIGGIAYMITVAWGIMIGLALIKGE
jgi:hypothetical protein